MGLGIVLATQNDMANLRLFADRLRETRQVYGKRIGKPDLSGKQFALILGIEAQRYRRYERAEIEPPLHVLALLRRVTGVSLDRLVAGLGPGDGLMITQHGAHDADTVILADRLRWVRETAMPDASEAAKLLKVDVEELVRWETDLDSPPIEKIVEFAARFSVTVQFLLDGVLEGLHPTLRAMLVEKYPQLLPASAGDSEASDRAANRA